MDLYLGKFLHTGTGKYLMSILLGLGLASLFRIVCKDKNCLIYHAPPLEKIKDKIFNINGKCVKYNAISTKCNNNLKIVDFE